MSLSDHRRTLAPHGFLRVAINLATLCWHRAMRAHRAVHHWNWRPRWRNGWACRPASPATTPQPRWLPRPPKMPGSGLPGDRSGACRPHRLQRPYVEIEGTYLVREDSPAQQVADLDREGLRIAVGRGAAYDLFLSRELRRAMIERAETSAAAITLFDQQRPDAAAGVRQPLAAWAKAHPGHRVLADRFTVIQQAVAAPASRPADALRALFEEVEAIKAGPLLEEAFARGGQAVTLVR